MGTLEAFYCNGSTVNIQSDCAETLLDTKRKKIIPIFSRAAFRQTVRNWYKVTSSNYLSQGAVKRGGISCLLIVSDGGVSPSSDLKYSIASLSLVTFWNICTSRPLPCLRTWPSTFDIIRSTWAPLPIINFNLVYISSSVTCSITSNKYFNFQCL